jgi:hypothetical protein
MYKGLFWVLGAWFFFAGPLVAQPSPAPSGEADKAPAAAEPPAEGSESAKSGATTETMMMDSVVAHRVWARPEYLLWWVKNPPLPVPVVTTGDPTVGFDPDPANTVNTAGALGQPGTRVLFGGNSIDVPALSGMRLTLGGWFEDKPFGIEGSGFVLERVTRIFTAASDEAGNPPLYFPIFSPIEGAERGIPIADPLRSFSGAVGVNTTLELWGADLNGIVTLVGGPYLEVTLLAGFRYADLREKLRIYNTTADLVFGNVTSLNDVFDTINQFYGGQIGSRLAVQRDQCFLELTGKVALGCTYQAVDIAGVITQAGPSPIVPPGPGNFPGGLFAQPSNIGRHSSSQFTVLSSLELKVGYDLSPRTRVFAGYDILYWNQVVRPGNQINRTVNLTQNAVLDPNGVGRLVGPAQPAPLSDRSGFWAHGINIGLEYRF